jgi:hypothetical protein
MINKHVKKRNKIYFFVSLLVLVYGLFFLIAHAPGLIAKKYFNHETKVKILLKSLNHINKVYINATPSERIEIEEAFKNLNQSLENKATDKTCEH